jgi:hypothetical protein
MSEDSIRIAQSIRAAGESIMSGLAALAESIATRNVIERERLELDKLRAADEGHEPDPEA